MTLTVGTAERGVPASDHFHRYNICQHITSNRSSIATEDEENIIALDCSGETEDTFGRYMTPSYVVSSMIQNMMADPSMATEVIKVQP